MINHEDSEETQRNEIANCLAENGESPNLQARDRTLNRATALHPKISKQIERQTNPSGIKSKLIFCLAVLPGVGMKPDPAYLNPAAVLSAQPMLQPFPWEA